MLPITRAIRDQRNQGNRYEMNTIGAGRRDRNAPYNAGGYNDTSYNPNQYNNNNTSYNGGGYAPSAYPPYTQYGSPSHSRDPSTVTLTKPPSLDEGLALETRVDLSGVRDGSMGPGFGGGSRSNDLVPMEEADARKDPRFRDGARTPPPTPDEVKFLTDKGEIDWAKFRTKEYWMKKETIIQTIAILVAIGLTVAFAVEKNNIIHWFEPIGDKIKNLKFGWLIPVAVLIVISFPPLFGHELILLLIGIIYGTWEGFAIAAAGTLIGEIITFYTFRYCCVNIARKYQEKSLQYAAFAELVKTGGFKIILAARFSAIPSHLTTAIFATCEVGFISFVSAAVLSLPKQIALVYVGVAYEESGSGDESGKSKAISTFIVVATAIVTIISLRYIRAQTEHIKGPLVYRRRKERQAKLAKGAYSGSMDSSSDSVRAPQPRKAANPSRLAEEGQSQTYSAPQGPPPSSRPPTYGS